jgi:hypothetical protein
MTSLSVTLPNGFAAVVSQGSPVQVGQVIGKRHAVREEVINIPQHLSLSVAKAKHVVKKNPGDTVSEGDVLAVRKRFFGLDTAILRSRVNGVVMRYERDSGNLIIRTSLADTAEELFSPVDGVISLCDNEKIVINTEKHLVSNGLGVGETAQGALFVLRNSFTEGVDEGALLFQLGTNAIGRIVVGKKFTREVLAKGIGMGILGAIGMEIADEDFGYFSAKFPTFPILSVDAEVMQRLVEWEGKNVFLDSPGKAIVFLQV